MRNKQINSISLAHPSSLLVVLQAHGLSVQPLSFFSSLSPKRENVAGGSRSEFPHFLPSLLCENPIHEGRQISSKLLIVHWRLIIVFLPWSPPPEKCFCLHTHDKWGIKEAEETQRGVRLIHWVVSRRA